MASLGKGVTLLAASTQGQFSTILLTAGQTLTFNHGLNRRAFQVIVTNQDGQILSLPVSQPQGAGRYDSLVVENNTPSPVGVFVHCRWEESSRELSLVAPNDERLTIYEPPDPLLFSESFEFSEGWPGTLATPNASPNFLTLITESFEFSEGWPGTLFSPTASPSFATLFEDSFENADGWPGT